jgi:ABC-type bacteriocin/lantibiotic exporter with double-glycine peptidase domain
MLDKYKNIRLPFQMVLRRGYFKNWVVGAILALLAAGFGLAIPYIIKLTVDEGITKKDLRVFLLLCLGAAAAILLKNIFEALSALRRTALMEKIRFDLNRRVFKNIQAMPQTWFLEKAAGETIYAVENDTSTLINVVGGAINDVFIEGVSLIAALTVIFTLNLTIGLAVVVFLPVLYFLSLSRFKKLQEIYQDKVGNDQAVLNFLEESFWRSYLIKIFNAASNAVRRYSRLLVRDVRLTIDRERQEAMSAFVPSILPLAATGAIYLFSGYQAIMGTMSLGTLAAIGGYIYQFISSSSRLLSHWQDLQPGLISAQRLASLLAQDKNARGSGNQALADISGAIQISGLHFSYAGDHKVFDGFDLDIAAGEYAVITGPSGCGKTTLLNLIMRLYPAGQGRITIDGKEIGSLPRELLGRRIVMCPQEPMLWNTTIKENIIYPDSRFDQERFAQASRIAGVDGFVAGMPKGYDTVIGENAACISQGQKQRISLARALIKQPEILLLDEAFSGLPQDEEARIIAQLRGLFPRMTIVLATHRLAAENSDARIIKMGG